MIQIRISPQEIRRVQKFLREYPARLRAVEGYLAYSAAEMIRERIQALVRDVAGSESYRLGLQVVRVETGAEGVAYAVRVKPTARGIDRVDPKKTVLLVIPRKNVLKATPDEILILQRYNPWTVETLPFQPDRGDANVVSRMVRDEEAEFIAKKRMRQMPQIRQELARAGKRPGKDDQRRVKVKPGTDVVPDVAFDALRMEFGFGGGAKVPHWRPSIRYAIANIGVLFKSGQMMDTLRDPSYSGWTRWPPAGSGTISAAEASTFEAFEKKIL